MRTKIKKICIEKYNETICTYKEVSIREWSLSPEVVDKLWVNKTALPKSELVTVIFPDIEDLKEYEGIKDFKYTLNFKSDFFTVESKGQDFSNLNIPSNGEISFKITYKNFNRLLSEINFIPLNYEIYGTNAQGVTSLLEKRVQEFNLRKVDSPDQHYIKINKSTFRLKYFLDTQESSGDSDMIITPVNIRKRRMYISYYYHYNKGSYADNIRFIPVYESRLRKYIEAINKNGKLTPGIYEIPSEIEFFVYWLDVFRLAYTVKKKFTIQLEVLTSDGDFSINSNEFLFTLKHHEDKHAQHIVTIKKSDLVSISIEHSDWLTVVDHGNHLYFKSVSAKQFKYEENQGFIKLTSKNTVRVITVNVTVEKTLVFDFEEFNFCLNKNPITLIKQTENATKVRMGLTMNFVGYEYKKEKIIQFYEYVFFKDKVVMFPGEEIQDFFTSLQNIDAIKINDSGIPISKELFFACQAEIKITECDFEGNTYEDYVLKNINFLPGTKPKAYPYLTNGTVRRTYTDSIISVSAIKEDFTIHNLGKIASNLVNNSKLKNRLAVCNISFKRSLADASFGNRSIIEKSRISLHPVPNTQEVINVIFQNQNFCPDWFSFSGEYEEIPVLTHTIAKDLLSSNDFKVETDQDKTIKLNTGWLFEEEIKILWELMLSPICFINLNNSWIKTIPISKKPLPFNSQKNINSQIVEFKIINDER